MSLNRIPLIYEKLGDEFMGKKTLLSILSIMVVTIISAYTQYYGNNLIANDNETNTQNKEVFTEDKGLSTDIRERIDRLEKGILLFGEGAKGSYYLTKVNSAYLEETNPGSIVVKVTIKNVRGKQIDLSELKYLLKDEKNNNSYIGKVLTTNIPSEININELRELDISFDIPDMADEYMFSVESSLDPMDVRWKVDNLKLSNT
jgi:hypothetical protein